MTQSSLEDFNQALSFGALFTTFVAAKTFVPVLKSRPGSSYTIVSGGMAHFCPNPTFWTGTIKNAAVNGFVLGLAAENASDALRVNCLCLHYGIAGLGTDKNQWGWPGVATRKVGDLFVALSVGKERGSIVCTKEETDIAGWVEKLSKQ